MNDFDGIVSSSRIRLARNFANFPFPSRLNDSEQILQITKSLFNNLSQVYDFDFLKLKNLSNLEILALIEQNLISYALMDNKDIASLAYSLKDGLSVMINEEDHIREQCILPGLSLDEAYQRLTVLDDYILENFDILFSEKLGFLTASPTNLGTGMRASVMLFLPGFTMFGKLGMLEDSAQRLGLTVRGKHGENSKAEAYMYQISNETSLGQTEEEILQNVINITLKICEMEKEFLNQLLKTRQDEIIDLTQRALGTLLYAHKLTTDEAVKFLSQVKLGVNLGIINLNNAKIIDELFVKVQPAHLMQLSARDLTQTERDITRAKYIKSLLSETLLDKVTQKL